MWSWITVRLSVWLGCKCHVFSFGQEGLSEFSVIASYFQQKTKPQTQSMCTVGRISTDVQQMSKLIKRTKRSEAETAVGFLEWRLHSSITRCFFLQQLLISNVSQQPPTPPHPQSAWQGRRLSAAKCHNRLADLPCQSAAPQGLQNAIVWANGPGLIWTRGGFSWMRTA